MPPGGDDADTHSDTAGTGEESPADAEQADGGATSDGRGTGEVDAAGDGGASNDNPMGNTRRKMSANGEFFVAYEPMPSPIPLNNLFELRLELYESADMQTSIEGADVEIEARMPEHDHGMNTAPKITEKSNGVYLVEGMKFHMPGTEEAEWVITVTVAEENAIDEVTFEVLTAEQ